MPAIRQRNARYRSQNAKQRPKKNPSHRQKSGILCQKKKPKLSTKKKKNSSHSSKKFKLFTKIATHRPKINARYRSKKAKQRQNHTRHCQKKMKFIVKEKCKLSFKKRK